MNFDINKLNVRTQQTKSEFLKDLVRVIILAATEDDNTLRIDLADYDGGLGTSISTKEFLDNLDKNTRITNLNLDNYGEDKGILDFSIITTTPNGRESDDEDEYNINIYPNIEKFQVILEDIILKLP